MLVFLSSRCRHKIQSLPAIKVHNLAPGQKKVHSVSNKKQLALPPTPPCHWLLKTNKNSYILLGQQGRGGWESPTQKPPATKHTGSKPNWQGQLQGNGSAVRVRALLSRGKRDSLHGEVRGRHGWLLTFLASSPRVMEGKRSSESGEESLISSSSTTYTKAIRLRGA